MKTLVIDVVNHSNLKGAFNLALWRDPDKIIFIGTAPAYEEIAREIGIVVEVFAEGSSVPEGASLVYPSQCLDSGETMTNTPNRVSEFLTKAADLLKASSPGIK